ncbi:MAG TPA: phosphoribosyltransferase [Steroidobacteraceae bacterium]
MSRRFADRVDAGRQLAPVVGGLDLPRDAIVLALPRGGVPVAAEIARALGLPLDVLCVRKLGVPFQPELAMGALASGGAVVRNEDVLAQFPSSEADFERVLAAERVELSRRERLYRGTAGPLQVTGRCVVLVDDGLATGATMGAAVAALRAMGAARIVVAVPVGAPDACARIAATADQVVCLVQPMLFASVGQWYETFEQTQDDEVRSLLAEATRRVVGGGSRTS